MVNNSFNFLRVINYSELSNWSVIPSLIIDNAIENARNIKIGRLLSRNKNVIEVENRTVYSRVTIRLYNKGVLLRDKVLGDDIGTKRQFKIKAGQFILSRIDARNGAFGIVPEELEGAIVTNDFLAFDINFSIVNPEYLLLLLSSGRYQNLWQNLSSGATNRQRIQEEQFLDMQISLPSLELQNTLVEDYNSKIKDAEKTLSSVEYLPARIEKILSTELGVTKKKEINDSQFFLQTISFKNLQLWGVEKNQSLLQYEFHSHTPVSFNQNPHLIKEIYRGKSPIYDSKSSKVILNQKCNRLNLIEVEYAKPVSEAWLNKIERDRFTQQGDIIINSTGEGTIGRATYISSEYAGHMIDSHILLCRVNPDEIDPLFLVYQFNSSYIQEQIEHLKSAQATKQTELGIDNLKKIQFILPKIYKQRIIADILKKEITNTMQLQNKGLNLLEKAKLDFERRVFGENKIPKNN
jgi:type I restriction enzyme S subunit